MPRLIHLRHALVSAAALVLCVPLALSAPAAPAFAAEGSDAAASDDGPGAGVLMLHGIKTTDELPAVRLGADMDVTVTGDVARVRVTQAFRNTSDQWMEATYLYPLPEDGAVDSLKMVVGQRVIIGRIEKRETARKIYEEAKTEGKKAGLVEQLRPNMFTNSVANIGPGETVLVQIEYQAPVSETNGVFSLRLPLVVGPRYTPPHTLTSAAAMRDADAVTAAPVLNPALGLKLNPTSITVHLAPGFEVGKPVSRYHRIKVSGPGDNRTVRLAAGDVPADRDFVLEWRSASAEPVLGLFSEHAADGDYVMATITPPADLSRAPTPPREMVFVIDNSGSMGGDSIREAKASLIHALSTLRPQDHFNVIRFDDTMTKLFDHSVAATPDQVALAKRYAKSLRAEGGTEMLPALKAALADAAASGGPDTLRQIIFLTDGAISNEREMLSTLAKDGGHSHVFLVGIGSAPNTYLMSRMSTVGGGTYTHVGTPEEVTARMVPLLDALEHPAARDLTVTVEGGTLDITPQRLPDIYAGRPLVLVGKTGRLSGTLTVSGMIGDQRWTRKVDLTKATPSEAIAKLWARRRITDIEADRTLGKLSYDEADEAIAEIGLAKGLVTSQTSLVAVDETPSRPAGQGLTRAELPINLPAGWDFETLFGGEAGRAAMHNSEEQAAAAEQVAQLDLPQTATGFAATLLNGLVMLLLGLTGLVLMRRRPQGVQ